MGVLAEPQFQDLRRAQLAEVLVQFDPYGLGMELPGGSDDDPAIAAPQIVHLFAGLQPAEPQHLVDHGFWRRVVGRKPRVIADLREQGCTTDHQQPTGSPHLPSNPTLNSAGGGNAPAVWASVPGPGFSTFRWKSLWKSTHNSSRKLSNTRRSLTFCTYIQQYSPCPR